MGEPPRGVLELPFQSVDPEVRVEPVTFYVSMVEEERTDRLFSAREGEEPQEGC